MHGWKLSESLLQETECILNLSSLTAASGFVSIHGICNNIRKIPFRNCISRARGKKRKRYEQCDIVRGATTSSTKSGNYKQIAILSNNINSQLDATIIVLLITLIISTCFGRSFRPSSGALNCVYSLWYNALAMLPAGDQDEVELILGMLLLTSRQHCRCIIPQSVNTV